MKKNFKTLTVLLAAILVAASLSACGKNTTTPTASAVSVETSIEETSTASVSETETYVEENSVSEETADTTVAEETATVESLVFEEGELGEGETQFIFVVADLDGNEKTFTINTNETNVGAALVNIGIIAGEDSSYGLYVKSVNGVTADWNVDQTYWAFYIDGEYAMTGVDSTEVVAGSTYKFQISK